MLNLIVEAGCHQMNERSAVVVDGRVGLQGAMTDGFCFRTLHHRSLQREMRRHQQREHAYANQGQSCKIKYQNMRERHKQQRQSDIDRKMP